MFAIRELRSLKSQECKLAARSIEVSLERWRNEVDMRCTQAREQATQAVQVKESACCRLAEVLLCHQCQKAMEDRSAKVRQSREKKEEAYIANRRRIEAEYQAQLEDRESKIEHWKKRTDALSKQKVLEIQKVCREFFRCLLPNLGAMWPGNLEVRLGNAERVMCCIQSFK